MSYNKENGVIGTNSLYQKLNNDRMYKNLASNQQIQTANNFTEEDDKSLRI